MALGLGDIARLMRGGGRTPLLGSGLREPPDISDIYSLEEAREFGSEPIATPEEEQEILRRFELREFGPKGSPGNPPIGNTPGDLDEEFRLDWLNFLMGRSGSWPPVLDGVRDYHRA